MVLGVVVPDGVGVKNYLYSGFPNIFLQNPENSILLFCNFLKEDGIQLDDESMLKRVSIEPLPNYNESLKLRLLRETICFARLYHFSHKLKNKTILGAAPRANSTAKKIFLKYCALFGKYFSGSYDKILSLENAYSLALAKSDVSVAADALRKNKVDALISLHQRPVQNIPFYEAARRMELKRFSIIYSWDNIAKARLFTPAQVYLLWSRYMKNQMNLFYPEIKDEQMVITGTPQFSFYTDESWHTDKASFCNQYHIDPAKPVVLFSGSDYRTSPFDPELLRDVATTLRSMDEQIRPQLVFRRSPADFTGRYDKVFENFPEIISIDPIWTNDGDTWTTAIPNKADIRNLKVLLQLCNVVINVSSTMALDAAIFDKPCIYMAFNPAEAEAAGFDYLKDIHEEDHFKVMKDINAVVYATDINQLGSLIKTCIETPGNIAPGRKAYLNSITDNLSNKAAENLVEAICGYCEFQDSSILEPEYQKQP